MTSALFFLIAVTAGILQVASLRRGARAARPDLFGLPLRMLLVGGVLVAAALAHCLMAAVAGWACASGLGTVVAVWRWS